MIYYAQNTAMALSSCLVYSRYLVAGAGLRPNLRMKGKVFTNIHGEYTLS